MALDGGPLLSGVDVARTTPASVISAFGDSLTEGFGAQGLAGSWPSLLSVRFNGEAAVINLGISGNRLLSDGTPALGQAGLDRFKHDALAQPGVTDVVILEGINDLNAALSPSSYGEETGLPLPTIEALISGHRDLIVRTRALGVKVTGATLLPWNAPAGGFAEAETIRLELNEWIRARAAYDQVIDFAALMADPDDPTRLHTDYDSGDGIHPNDSGYAAMAMAVFETLAQE